MKNPIAILLSLLLFLPLILQADEMSVKSFRRLDKDMDARYIYPEKDPTGRTCAIIKVVNPNKEFVFDTGSVAVVKSRQETGEIWVYVQPGVKKLTIKHPTLGVLRDYYFPMAIEEATVYELKLTSDIVHSYIEQKATSAYLVVNSVPEGADVYIGGEWEGQTPFNKKYSQGQTLQYRISHPLYHDEVGEVKIDKTRIEVNANLKEAFGSIRVNSEPSGASVFLDNENKSRGSTPLTINEIASGPHSVRVQLPRYKQSVLDVTVTDGNTSIANANLLAAFTTITVNSLPEATIKADGAFKGTGSASWEQDTGVCDIEVSLKGHRSLSRQIEVKPGESQTLTLEPIPLYGILAIESDPAGADIYLDGVKRGISPDVLDHVLAMEHTVKLSKPGYVDYSTEVTIRENEETTVRGKLSSGKSAPTQSGQGAHNVSENFGNTPQSARENGSVKEEEGKSGIDFTYDTSYDISTVDKEPTKSPLLPNWWNMSQDNLYVGISYPTADAKTAKLSALMNAIELFCIDTGMETKYRAIADQNIVMETNFIQTTVTEDLVKYEQAYAASKTCFSVAILEEYYNNVGEYFILCSIKEDKNSSDSLCLSWDYQDNNNEGGLKSNAIFKITINGNPINCLSEYSCSWDKRKVYYTDMLNGVRIWEYESNLSDYPNTYLSKKELPLGFEQKQYLSSLPLIPDSLTIESQSTMINTNEREEIGSSGILHGYGKSQGRKIGLFKLKGNKNAGIIPMIKEVFPAEIPTLKNKWVKEESEVTGLDPRYYIADDVCNLVLDGDSFSVSYDGSLWEQSKNNSFIGAIIGVNHSVKSESYGQIASETSESERKEEFNTISSNTLAIYPLWYMDATLRQMPKKKKDKDSESTLKLIDNSVMILCPRNK